MFLFKQCQSHQLYQLLLQKRLRGNLNDFHFQKDCTDVLACTVFLFQNFYFYYYGSSLQFGQCISRCSQRLEVKRLPSNSVTKSIGFCDIFTHFNRKLLMCDVIKKYQNVLQINAEFREIFRNNLFVTSKRNKNLQETKECYRIKNGQLFKTYL